MSRTEPPECNASDRRMPSKGATNSWLKLRMTRLCMRPTVMTVQERQTVVEHHPSGAELARRTLALLFGIIQAVILLRIVFLLLDAREANALVSGILNFSQLFVAPFEGILRTDALHSGGSVLDIAAILAFIGWTLLEALAIAAVNIFRREPV